VQQQRGNDNAARDIQVFFIHGLNRESGSARRAGLTTKRPDIDTRGPEKEKGPPK
jgi:hypothetical protein